MTHMSQLSAFIMYTQVHPQAVACRRVIQDVHEKRIEQNLQRHEDNCLNQKLVAH